MAKIKVNLTSFFCFMIRIYQCCLSRFFYPTCRFQPVCSSYALQAFKKKGVLIGGFYTIKRLLRCHPWTKGGYDPIESNEEKKTWI